MTQYGECKTNGVLNIDSCTFEGYPYSSGASIKQSETSYDESSSKVASIRSQIDHLVTFKGLESTQKVANDNEAISKTITNRIDPKISNYCTAGNTQLILNQVDIYDRHLSEKDFKSNGEKVENSTASAQSKQREKEPFRYSGIIATLICAFCFSIQSVAIRLLPNPHSLNEKAKALFFRGFFLLVFCTSTCIYNKTSLKIPKGEYLVNFLRCITGSVSQLGAFISLAYIGAGDSKAIIFTAPIWTSIVSRIVFNDKFKLIQVFALPTTMLGIVLVAHPSLIVGNDSTLLAKPLLDSSLLNQLTNITLEPKDDWLNETAMTESTFGDGFTYEKRWLGFLISLGVSFLATANYIVLTFRKRTPVQTTTFWLGIAVLVTSSSVMAVTGYGSMPDTLQEWIILVTIGFAAWTGQSLLQWAFLYERADILSIVRTSDVAFTFLMSALVLDEPLYATSIMGALIITSVVILLILNDVVTKFFAASKNYSIKDTSNGNLLSKGQQVYTIFSDKSQFSDGRQEKRW